MRDALRRIWAVARRPVESFYELKYVRYVNIPLTLVLLALWFVSEVVARQFTGFRFQLYDPNELNILIQFVSTVVIFLIFCICNWAVCAISEGEGKFGEICSFLSLALVPYIVFNFLGTALSNVLVLQEAMFLHIFTGIGLLWTCVLFFHALRIVHNYSAMKTIWVFLLSVFLIGVIAFILVLLFSLFNQVYSFGYSIYRELLYRS